MKRDGYCMSLWQRGTPAYLSQTLALPSQADVVIIGGGITGLTTALLLQKAGKKCVLAEAHTIGFGTTGGTTAHLNTLMDTPYYQIAKNFGEDSAKLVAQGARNAIELISRNIQEYAIACSFKKLPGYIFSQNDKEDEELAKLFEGSIKAGIAVEYSGYIPAPIKHTNAIIFGEQAQFHPADYIYGLAKAFEEAGGKLIQNCRITNISNSNSLLDISSSLGNIKAQQVVYATHIPPGVNRLHFYCAPYRSYAMAIKLKEDNYPDALLYDMMDPYHYYRTQEINGEKFLIAGGADHKTGHDDNAVARFNELKEYFSRYNNIDRVEYRWSSQYYEPADGLPYIGLLPGSSDNVYVATGFGGNGLIYGTLAGLVISDLIGSGQSEYGELFNPGRVKPIAGFENIVKEAADVVAQLTAGLLAGADIEGINELKRGEAKLIKHHSHTLAVYKDATGELYTLNSSCPHIKCNVKWNSAEKSWDCPCHGSRFSFTGELLTAPATKDLESITLKEVRSKNE